MTELKEFFNEQLSKWKLAKDNYASLENVYKKPFEIGKFKGIVQCNPQRIASTLAKTDKESIKERKCFLCSCNRPKEQMSKEILPGWELLVNPYPILSFHFTIANKNHEPQRLNLETGKRLAEKMPGMVVFYNDDGAGASAPDHGHYQAVAIGDLPLIQLIEKGSLSERDLKDLPFQIMFNEVFENSEIPVNAYCWKNESNNTVQSVIIPRKRHRPNSFYLDPPYRRGVSPGAIDMAGVIVTPFEEDFFRLDNDDILKIYQEVGKK